MSDKLTVETLNRAMAMLPKLCEECMEESKLQVNARYSISVVDVPNSTQHQTAYRRKFLCYGHGSQHKGVGTSRLECLHVNQEDGECLLCGEKTNERHG